jgi:peptidoglycan/xylan/chitin deacetylase (PgdA/CDA1 family)
VILTFAAIAPIAMIALWPYSPAAGVGVLFVSHMLVLFPTLAPNVQWLGPVVTRFATSKKEVWLTIDDGPTSDTEAILDLFEERGVKATFFVKGSLATREAIDAMRRRGHTVGNHTQNHPSGSFWCLLPGRIAAEIDDCTRAIGETRWFRAPVGMKNPFVHPLLARRNMRLIGWSARGLDGVKTTAEQVVARVLAKLEPGAILVLHQGRPHTLETFARVIAEVQARGYAFVVPEDERLITKR